MEPNHIRDRYLDNSKSELEDEEVYFNPGAWLVIHLHRLLGDNTRDKISWRLDSKGGDLGS